MIEAPYPLVVLLCIAVLLWFSRHWKRDAEAFIRRIIREELEASKRSAAND